MIIFDRFLCCINLKSFGKFIGWTGAMTLLLFAYGAGLVLSAKPAKFYELTRRFTDVDNIPKNDSLALGLLIGTWTVVFLIHVFLIVGVKYVSVKYQRSFGQPHWIQFLLIDSFQNVFPSTEKIAVHLALHIFPDLSYSCNCLWNCFKGEFAIVERRRAVDKNFIVHCCRICLHFLHLLHPLHLFALPNCEVWREKTKILHELWFDLH